ncbi:MAG: lycopene cyclase domain-containing protein, partial [Chitinophagales bacterium]
MYSYLLINCASIAIPLLLSFEKRVAYYKKWKALIPAIALMAFVFIAWDIYFTHIGIWGFNPKYLSGIYLANLPLEEYLFFFCIPYSCLFIYEVLNYYNPDDILKKYRKGISVFLLLLLVLLAIAFHDRLYTVVTFTLTSIFLLYLLISGKDGYLGRFYLAYAVSLIPFFIVNGILTGTALTEPIVWYNDAENIGYRLGTIPVEDTIYSMIMLLMTTHFY